MSGGYFGDRLQSIYGFDGGGGALDRPCDEHVEETFQLGHRWRDDADFRGWHHGSRQALLAGEAIDLRNRPSCVRVHLWERRAAGRQPERALP